MSFFSVIIPTYQRTVDLTRCLDQLKPGKQSLNFDQYEVIVTDDERNESKSRNLIEQEYQWAKWVAGPSKGPAANRNNGAILSSGEWLVFTDDDCLPDKNWLLAILETIERQENVVEVIEGKTIAGKPKPGLGWEAPINKDGGKLWTCNLAIKRELFMGLGGFDEEYPVAAVEDVDFRKRIFLAGMEVKFIEEALIIHPWRPVCGFKQQLMKSRSWKRYYSKYPDELTMFNWTYYSLKLIAPIVELIKLPFCKTNIRLIGNKVAEIAKVLIMIKLTFHSNGDFQ